MNVEDYFELFLRKNNLKPTSRERHALRAAFDAGRNYASERLEAMRNPFPKNRKD
jgi:hypothetical protein